MSKYSENNDFQNILNRLLANVDDGLDKRQGSIIYDALAPAAAELAQCYIALDVYTDQSYLLTAVGENLDNKVADYGLIRNEATFSEVYIEVYNENKELMNIDLGSKFSIPNEYGGYNFTITAKQSTGKYIGMCETPGTYGNLYLGELLPLQPINNLGSALIIGIHKPGTDIETDEQLRQRTLDKLQKSSFGGNIASYKQYVESIDGVGQCLVIPIWNGGGTVKLVIINSDYSIPDDEFINEIQTLIDPVQNSGEGYGIAPVGHKVTVTAPNKFDINIKCLVDINSSYSEIEVKTNIRKVINEYINSIQSKWSISEDITIYVARLIGVIISVEGVDNVSNVMINDYSRDLVIPFSIEETNYPVINSIKINDELDDDDSVG